jgi:hypothetical protein
MLLKQQFPIVPFSLFVKATLFTEEICTCLSVIGKVELEGFCTVLLSDRDCTVKLLSPSENYIDLLTEHDTEF